MVGVYNIFICPYPMCLSGLPDTQKWPNEEREGLRIKSEIKVLCCFHEVILIIHICSTQGNISQPQKFQVFALGM